MRMFITSKNKYLSNDMKIFGTCSIPLNVVDVTKFIIIRDLSIVTTPSRVVILIRDLSIVAIPSGVVAVDIFCHSKERFMVFSAFGLKKIHIPNS